MHSISISKTINAPADKVWAALDDFGSIADFHPGLHSSATTNGVSHGLGAERVCDLKQGGPIYERVTKHVAGKTLGIEITDFGKLPMKHASGDFELEAVGQDATKVSIDFAFQPKFGPIGWLMAQLIMKPQLKKGLSTVITGLEEHLNSEQTNDRQEAVLAV
jgi:carbon monoxide dehydrogenase subunit G